MRHRCRKLRSGPKSTHGCPAFRRRRGGAGRRNFDWAARGDVLGDGERCCSREDWPQRAWPRVQPNKLSCAFKTPSRRAALTRAALSVELRYGSTSCIVNEQRAQLDAATVGTIPTYRPAPRCSDTSGDAHTSRSTLHGRLTLTPPSRHASARSRRRCSRSHATPRRCARPPPAAASRPGPACATA